MVAGERSQRIYGRVHRILTKNLGQDVIKILKEEIYDEMQQSQVQIFAEVLPERKFDITLIDSTDEYSLLEESTDREIIHLVKSVITPVDWDYKFEFVNNGTQWNEILKSDTDVAQPLKATIIGNSLFVFPVPDSTYGGNIITLLTLLKSPTTTISDTVDPELTDLFDKPIEWLTLFGITQDLKYYTLAMEDISTKLNYAVASAEEENVKECNW